MENIFYQINIKKSLKIIGTISLRQSNFTIYHHHITKLDNLLRNLNVHFIPVNVAIKFHLTYNLFPYFQYYIYYLHRLYFLNLVIFYFINLNFTNK